MVRRIQRSSLTGCEYGHPIPLNEVRGSQLTRSFEGDMTEFVRRLNATGIATTVRDTRGSDVDAACGQLAASG